MSKNKDYDWRIADWTDPEDHSVEAEKDCEKIQEVSPLIHRADYFLLEMHQTMRLKLPMKYMFMQLILPDQQNMN